MMYHNLYLWVDPYHVYHDPLTIKQNLQVQILLVEHDKS